MDFVPIPRQAGLVLIHAFMRHGNGLKAEELQAVDALSKAVYGKGGEAEPALSITVEPVESLMLEPAKHGK
jgi:hypothetical protein